MRNTEENQSVYSKQLNLADNMHNIVTERAEPIHSYSKFIDKLAKELSAKRNFSFGTHQRRLTQQACAEGQKKSPGPGFYHPVYQNQQLSKEGINSQSIPFGTKIERFKKIKTSPGPGHYNFMEQKAKLKRYSCFLEKYKKKISKKKEKDSKQKIPGPGCYQIQEEKGSKLKKNEMKEKLQKIKQKRRQGMNKLTKDFRNYKNHNKATLIQNQNSESVMKTSIKEKKQVQKIEGKDRLRQSLNQKVKQYLPSIDLIIKKEKQNEPNSEKLMNIFLKKNDYAYGSYLRNLQTSDPGIYQKTKKVQKYFKKSYVFMSKSKRQMF